MSKVHQVSFYAGGEPNDFGDDLCEIGEVLKKADPYFNLVSISVPRALFLKDKVFFTLS
jgi:hypothetical protein